MVRSVLTYHEIFGSEGWENQMGGTVGELLLLLDPKTEAWEKNGWMFGAPTRHFNMG